jgi:hypothetical protein
MVKWFVLLFSLMIMKYGYTNDTCSRVAIVNYQQVLVDAGSGKMGEGLRFYLEKDPVSKKLLNEYQEKNKPTFWSASASTVGSLLVLASLSQTSEEEGIQNKNTLLYTGGALIALSYLTSKTLKYSNEKILKNAIDQYNKRNSPHIYFSPYKDNNNATGLGVGIQQEF